MTLETVSEVRSHGGTHGVYRHESSATGTMMSFAVFVPDHGPGTKMPVLWYLSGLTCTHANVVEKGEYRASCAAEGIIFVAPDTSPRGDGVPNDPDGGWDFGSGAGFYVDATQAPYDRHYRMWTYVTEELPRLIEGEFPADSERQGITGHSMGGHGALTIGLTYPGRFRSVSAFAPIVAPSQVPWGEKAFRGYFGSDRQGWRAHDAVSLLEDGARVAELLVDIGSADPFLERELRPELLERACGAADVPLSLRMQPGYDHSYYFISSFMADHVRWHAERLKGPC